MWGKVKPHVGVHNLSRVVKMYGTQGGTTCIVVSYIIVDLMRSQVSLVVLVM